MQFPFLTNVFKLSGNLQLSHVLEVVLTETIALRLRKWKVTNWVRVLDR